jgi:hypothetical protein
VYATCGYCKKDAECDWLGFPDTPVCSACGRKEHRLKTHPPYFDLVADGTKTFELRRHDRNFRQGDTLILEEYDPAAQAYTGRVCWASVTYVLSDAQAFGLREGFCALGIKLL